MFGKSQQIHPHFKVAEVDRTFTTVARPLLLQTSWGRNDDNNNMEEGHVHDSPHSPATTPTIRSPFSPTKTNRSSTVATMRTGDNLSFTFNSNNTVTIPPRSSQRMYRILAIREEEDGKKIFFDMVDGRIYGRGPGLSNRMARNVVLYENRDAALSERFPSNQVGAARSGNGIPARILVSFDAWGDVHRRYGGGNSYLCEFAKIMKIVEFLDPPHPVPKRLSDVYVDPYFFTKADHTAPNRQRADSYFKLNKLFTTPHSPKK